MKISIFFLFVCVFHLFALNGEAQNAIINLPSGSLTIGELIKSIESQTNYLVVYSNSEIDTSSPLSLRKESLKVSESLQEAFKDEEIRYEFENNYIILSKKAIVTNPSQTSTTIKGTVMDSYGDPIIGANVVEKGTTNGSITNMDGEFTLTLMNGNNPIVVTYIGYIPQEISIGNREIITIQLIEDTQNLDEIVVIGYGTQKKRDLTSSVSSVKAENFNKGAVMNNPLQLVEGKVAGLTVTRAHGTDPNAGINVQLRGVSSVKGETAPLIVIDGVPGGDLNTVLPQDIESIDVLKDGSAAAIYGTRGTNGVILVTTKKGQGGAVRINYETQLYTETVAKRLDVLTTEQYKQFGYDHDKIFMDFGYDTHWFDELVQTPFSHIHNLSISGGSNTSSYRASLSYKNQEGIVYTKATRETLNGRINLMQKTWDDKLRFDMNLSYTNIDASFVNIDDNNTDYVVFEQAIKRNPTEPVYNNDGTYFYPTGSEEFEFNPIARLENVTNGAEYNRFMGDMRITLEPITGLKGSIMGAIKKQSDLTRFYESRLSEGSEERGDSGTAERRTVASMDKTLEGTIEYTGQTGKHSYSGLVGYSYQDFTYERYSAKNNGFITDVYQWNNLATGSYLKEGKAVMTSTKNSSKLIAFFGRANYNYDNRYMASVTVRREGSSRFGDNHKWGTFPAVSAGWRINNESFMEDIDWLSDFKVRIGYGLTGNQMNANYISIARMGTQQYVYHDGQYIQTYGLSTNPNPSLKWEVKKELNVGLDASLWDNRLGFTFDVYERKNSDLLYEVQASVPSLIHGTVWANVGEMKSNDVEMVVYGDPIRNHDMVWNISANFSYNKSRLLSLSNDEYISAANYIEFGNLPAPGNLGNSIRLEENGKVGNFYGYEYVGLTEEGKWIFKDQNEDGKIDNDDKVVIGNGVPKFFAGLNTSFMYKNFDVSLQLKGAFGFDILNTKEMYYGNPSFYPSNLLVSVLDKHKDLNDSPQYSSYYLEKGNYVKVSNLTIGYTYIPPIKYLRNVRVYVSADNLLTFTGYTGIDPELTSSGYETGIDARHFYPRTRTFTFGLNVGF